MPCIVVYKIRRQRTFMLTAGPSAIAEHLALKATVAEVLLERQRPRPSAPPLPPLEWVIARYERAPWMFGRVVAKWPA